MRWWRHSSDTALTSGPPAPADGTSAVPALLGVGTSVGTVPPVLLPVTPGPRPYYPTDTVVFAMQVTAGSIDLAAEWVRGAAKRLNPDLEVSIVNLEADGFVLWRLLRLEPGPNAPADAPPPLSIPYGDWIVRRADGRCTFDHVPAEEFELMYAEV